MNNANFIQLIDEHLAQGQKNAYTGELLMIAHRAVLEESIPPEQRNDIIKLMPHLEKLQNPQQLTSFLGASAANLK